MDMETINAIGPIYDKAKTAINCIIENNGSISAHVQTLAYIAEDYLLEMWEAVKHGPVSRQ